MPAERCPLCGEVFEAARGSCPGCGLAAEDMVASWVSGPGEVATAGEEAICPACGYAGELDSQGDLAICPACLVAVPKDREATASLVRRVVPCPGCGLAIGLTDADRDRTVVCSRCQYFLGCLLKGERRRARRASRGPG